jgi:hypothetical protein
MDFGGAPTGNATSPRVNKTTMGAYVGHTVALVGSVESHTPTDVVLRTSVSRLSPWQFRGKASNSCMLLHRTGES